MAKIGKKKNAKNLKSVSWDLQSIIRQIITINRAINRHHYETMFSSSQNVFNVIEYLTFKQLVIKDNNDDIREICIVFWFSIA